MNRLLLLSFSVLAVMLSTGLIASGGVVTVSVDSSTDLSTWSSSAPGVVDVSSTQPYFRVKIVPSAGGEPSYSEVVQANTDYPGKKVVISVESGTNLSDWSDDVVGDHDVSGAKKFFRIRAVTEFSEFILVDASTQTFDDFYLGKYEVTAEEWEQTYDWAVQNGYAFSTTGIVCSATHPIRAVAWFDIIKWCNARSERDGRDPVYFTDAGFTTLFKTGTPASAADVYWDTSKNGYRLPLEAEWYFAADDGNTYSGSNVADEVAWYAGNSAGAECGGGGIGTWPVGSKAANAIGAYDMSGNVGEYVYDSAVSSRVHWGGAFDTSTNIFGDDFLALSLSDAKKPPAETDASAGFRLAYNVEPAAAEAAVIVEASVSSKPGKKDKRSKPSLR